MDVAAADRIRILGRGNLIVALLLAARFAFVFSDAGRFNSYSYDEKSYQCLILVVAVLAGYTALSAIGLLRRSSWAVGVTCHAGGLTMGYAGMGNFIMAAFGAERGLDRVIRHGSEYWWAWSISRFQNPMWVEGPLMVWWLYALWSLHRAIGKEFPPPSVTKRAMIGIFIGVGLRVVQVGTDVTLLSSQR